MTPDEGKDSLYQLVGLVEIVLDNGWRKTLHPASLSFVFTPTGTQTFRLLN